jgi:HEPN domain-containing protein
MQPKTLSSKINSALRQRGMASLEKAKRYWRQSGLKDPQIISALCIQAAEWSLLSRSHAHGCHPMKPDLEELLEETKAELPLPQDVLMGLRELATAYLDPIEIKSSGKELTLNPEKILEWTETLCRAVAA